MSKIGPRNPASVVFEGRLSISDLLWVANTRHGPAGHWFARPVTDTGDHDHMSDSQAAVEYLVAHKVSVPDGAPTAADLRRLRSIRTMVRSLIGTTDGWTADVAAIVGSATYTVNERHELAAIAAGWRGFVNDLIPPLLEIVASRARIRQCGNPLCRLIFVDESKNHSRRWCDTTGCGNRVRVRRHRELITRPDGNS